MWGFCSQSQVQVTYIACVRYILGAVQSHKIINQKDTRNVNLAIFRPWNTHQSSSRNKYSVTPPIRACNSIWLSLVNHLRWECTLSIHLIHVNDMVKNFIYMLTYICLYIYASYICLLFSIGGTYSPSKVQAHSLDEYLIQIVCIQTKLVFNSNSNIIYFKSLKSQWFSGHYMSNTHTNTNIQAYTIWGNEENLNFLVVFLNMDKHA